jgi:TPP-dependent 2-oxoacid decarboxylase
LLSIAKTCIYVGRHFSNDLQSSKFAYQLKETEFITLTGSYCNILARIFKQIEQPKNINDFVKTVIELSIFDKTTQNEKYANILNKSQQFTRIKQFFKTIYNDSKFGLYDRNSKENLIKIRPNNKFNILLKWTVKNLNNILE